MSRRRSFFDLAEFTMTQLQGMGLAGHVTWGEGLPAAHSILDAAPHWTAISYLTLPKLAHASNFRPASGAVFSAGWLHRLLGQLSTYYVDYFGMLADVPAGQR